MARKVMTPGQFRRLQARVKILRILGHAAFLALCLSTGFVVAATAFPQRRILEKFEAKQAAVRTQEKIVYGELDQARTEFQALREDPSFLEIHARDRLDYYREGERVFRFRRGE